MVSILSKMEESEENTSVSDLSQCDSPANVKPKLKKRSLVERELETNLTERVTSPITNGGLSSTSRYGRARRLKASSDFTDTDKAVTEMLKSSKSEKSPKLQSPAYKMHALNSPIKIESPKPLKNIEHNIENKIDIVYDETMSIGCLAEEKKKIIVSPTKKNNKIYVRKDLIQNQEKEETFSLIRNIFSPTKSTKKPNSHLNNILERSSEKYSLSLNGSLPQVSNSDKKKSSNNHIKKKSVVKILDFDSSKKKKRDSKEGEKLNMMSKSELFEMEAKCDYQVGDLAWARMGTFPFWPCIVTREPSTGFFVKKKMFGRVERDIVHVTFFGDNGRRSWIVENMLRNYLGELEFEHTRDQFTIEAKKRDPKLYAAFFISEKKLPFWKHSIEEAEQLLKEPKRLRIDILNHMLLHYIQPPKNHKSEKVSRTNSDVSLSESLYDTLFSEDDGKNDDAERTRNKSKNKSLDVSEVVTACLDNMAAKTGITKIQRQSHMDIWLQKAKSKTPEKLQEQFLNNCNNEKQKSASKNKKASAKNQKPYSFRSSVESQNKSSTLLAHQNEHDYSIVDPIAINHEYDQSSDDFNLKPDIELTGSSGAESVPVLENIDLPNDIIMVDLVVDHLKASSYEKIIELPVSNGLPDNIMEGDDQMIVEDISNEEKTDLMPQITTDDKNKLANKIPVNDLQPESPTFTQDYDADFNLDVDKTDSHEPCLLSLKNTDSAVKSIETVNDVLMEDTLNLNGEIINDEQIGIIQVNSQADTEAEEALDCNNVKSDLNQDIADSDKNCDVQNNDSSSIENIFSANSTNVTNSEIINNAPSTLQTNEDQVSVIKDLKLNMSVDEQLEANSYAVDKIIQLDVNNRNTNISAEENKIIDCNILTDDENINSSNGDNNSDSIQIVPETKSNISQDQQTTNVNSILEKCPENVSKSDKKELRNRKLEVRLEKMPKFFNLCLNRNKKNLETKDDCSSLETAIDEVPIKKEENKNPELDMDFSDAAKQNGVRESRESSPFLKIKEEIDPETASLHSETSEVSNASRKSRKNDKSNEKKFCKTSLEKALENPEFVQYMELRQDAIIEENPELTQDDIVLYLYNTWIYEESLKGDRQKADDIEQANLVKGLKTETTIPAKKPRKKKDKVEKQKKGVTLPEIQNGIVPKDKPTRRVFKPYYNEEYDDVDLEDEIKLFEIFRKNKNASHNANDTHIKIEDIKTEPTTSTGVTDIKNEVQEPNADNNEEIYDVDEQDEVELYFEQLTEPKPNVFKGLIRDTVCEICETTGNLARCKVCCGHFHVDCVKKQLEVVEVAIPTRGRKKKKKTRGRKPKGYEETGNEDSHSDEKDANVSEENPDISIEEEPQTHTVDAENFEAQLETKMKEILQNADDVAYDSTSDNDVTWIDTVPGKCEIVDVKVKIKQENPDLDNPNFTCNDCENNDTPLCFVCKAATSPKNSQVERQKCSVGRCNKHFHLSCLEHWPQTQFKSGIPSKAKQAKDHTEAITCPRHVCHTCVSDDPRGCKTRFNGEKLARCIRCPATYHTFTKCLPAGTQILTGSYIICPRHYQHRPGKVPCHVNTGWCFICALGGSLICCEYCPTSFHAECLNIDPPEGGYMCEDCETGRLPLYGEMVWVKLGHYRWWPGLILHPCEIPENIMAVKHSFGEFVVRFFGQYDHYWVNRGRVFPFQEGDSGKISSQKSKIDEAFTMAMEHAHRAYDIIKSSEPNSEESSDIAQSLLPPQYVKLKSNRPLGSLVGRRGTPGEEGDSTTQCDCDPRDPAPCSPNTHCLNRMLLTECGPWCKAGDMCQNRAFEKRQYPKLVPYRTPHRGWGLKTLDEIKQGQFVIEYVGELIDEEEFRRRMTRKHEMRDENFYFLTLDKERMIDAGPKGNLARFMNHSCEPNCETQKWTVLGDVRVGLFALYDIPANTEVNFNYNLESAGIDKKRCMCGAKRCSGYMGAKPKQEEPQPKKNKLRPSGKRTYKKRKNIEISPSTSACKKSPKPRLTTRSKPRELTDIEKDLLIIKNATNGISSDSECSERLTSIDKSKDMVQKALKRKRVSFSTEDGAFENRVTESSSVKKMKLDHDKTSTAGEVGD